MTVLLTGWDPRTDQQGNDLPRVVLDQLYVPCSGDGGHAAPSDRRDYRGEEAVGCQRVDTGQLASLSEHNNP